MSDVVVSHLLLLLLTADLPTKGQLQQVADLRFEFFLIVEFNLNRVNYFRNCKNYSLQNFITNDSWIVRFDSVTVE